MNIINTAIDGVVIIEPRVFEDARGYFFESFSQRDFDEKVAPILGHTVTFVQDNESKSSYGVMRGLHFQRPPFTQSKLVRCVKGAVLDVAVDILRVVLHMVSMWNASSVLMTKKVPVSHNSSAMKCSNLKPQTSNLKSVCSSSSPKALPTALLSFQNQRYSNTSVMSFIILRLMAASAFLMIRSVLIGKLKIKPFSQKRTLIILCLMSLIVHSILR